MKTTEENNRMIAEFMGYDLSVLYDLDFDFSWDWLMPVVEKITILEEFHEWEFNSSFWDVFCQLDMSEIYNQGVQFIEWYNEQK